MVSWRTHDGVVRRLGEARYISNFRWNLISLSRLDSNNYRWVADDEILKTIRGSRIIIKGRKYREHYLLIGSLVRDGASGAKGSLM